MCKHNLVSLEGRPAKHKDILLFNCSFPQVHDTLRAKVFCFTFICKRGHPDTAEAVVAVQSLSST